LEEDDPCVSLFRPKKIMATGDKVDSNPRRLGFVLCMLIGAISTRKQNVDARLPACYALLNRSSQWADFQRAKLSAVSSRQLFLVMDVSCMDALEVQNLRSDVQTT
jgi:hypothetical protein